MKYGNPINRDNSHIQHPGFELGSGRGRSSYVTNCEILADVKLIYMTANVTEKEAVKMLLKNFVSTKPQAGQNF